MSTSKTGDERRLKVGICLDCSVFQSWPSDEPAPTSCGECDGPIIDIDCVRSTWPPSSYDRDQIREFYLRLWEAGTSQTWPGDHKRIDLPDDAHRDEEASDED